MTPKRSDKFTEGPWMLAHTSHGSHTEITKDHSVIGVVFNGVFEDGSTGLANARLIALAPEMVELLRLSLHKWSPAIADDIAKLLEKLK